MSQRVHILGPTEPLKLQVAFLLFAPDLVNLVPGKEFIFKQFRAKQQLRTWCRYPAPKASHPSLGQLGPQQETMVLAIFENSAE